MIAFERIDTKIHSIKFNNFGAFIHSARNTICQTCKGVGNRCTDCRGSGLIFDIDVESASAFVSKYAPDKLDCEVLRIQNVCRGIFLSAFSIDVSKFRKDTMISIREYRFNESVRAFNSIFGRNAYEDNIPVFVYSVRRPKFYLRSTPILADLLYVNPIKL